MYFDNQSVEILLRLRKQTPSHGVYIVGSAMPLSKLMYCVTISFKMAERVNQQSLCHGVLARRSVSHLLQSRFSSLRHLVEGGISDRGRDYGERDEKAHGDPKFIKLFCKI